MPLTVLDIGGWKNRRQSFMHEVFETSIFRSALSQNVQIDHIKDDTNLKSGFDLFRLSKSARNVNFNSFR